ncbi:MAG: hypothetical protein KGL39_12710 [Patescibacteria group bacterium]|nr:hypothetical protein [Patescibacteria group bacterium]
MIRDIFPLYELGCNCAAIEYSSGTVRVIPWAGCPVHKGEYFPPPPPTERERYEAAMRGEVT